MDKLIAALQKVLAGIQIKKVPLNPKNFERLSALILHDESGMADVLRGNNSPMDDVLGAWDGDKLIGWTVVGGNEGRLGYNPIVMVYVEPEYRQKGVGKQLLEAMLKKFRKTYKPSMGDREDVVYYAGKHELFAPLIEAAGFIPKRIM